MLDVWSKSGKWVLWFMSGSSLTRLNVVRRTGVRQVSPVRNDFVCLAFPTVLWRAREQVAVALPQSARDEASDPSPSPRTPLGLSWPPWDSSRTPISCVRLSASPGDRAHLREGAFPPPSLLRASGCHWGMHGCLYTDALLMTKPVHGHEGVSCLSYGNWPWFWMLQFPSCFRRHAYSYSNSLMEIADWLPERR